MTEGIIVQLITTVGVVIAAWLGNRKLNKIRDDARVARRQTENEHAETEYPNMRDEITAFRLSTEAGFRRMDHQFGEMHDRQVTTDRRIEGVESNARAEHERIWKALEK